RTRRIEVGMSQQRLAEVAGLHRSYVGSVERGERDVALLNIVRLGVALGFEPAELVCGLGRLNLGE
ncbi:MAG TPA: helix-turn-helix transcriptional regulator, partial [Acidimicrobiales bacterium]|nr:helix-turn-helix transcriptional regulator [Acidimicrobiales bacterium]